MSPATSASEVATYRNARPYPFCPGCGHGLILDALDEALTRLGRDPARVVIVSDIGCSGLSDQYFKTSAFHGLHGRSLTYATGIQLANPELSVIVVMGDGGAGIGGAHLLAAARRNVGVTLLVFNNLNFGMTGGQPSATTPEGAITGTTPGGHLERPLDLCATVAVNGAAYAYRGTSFDEDLPARIVEAIETPGFALLDIWELCTAHFVPANHLSKKALFELMDRLGMPRGVVQRREVVEYAAAYRNLHAEERGRQALPPRPIEPRFTATLDRPLRLTLAGSAGAGVRTAANLLAEAALLCDLWAAARDDYPITVRSGYSLSDVVLAPGELEGLAAGPPDVLVVLSPEGRDKARATLAALDSGGRVFAIADVANDLETTARISVIDLAGAGKRVPKTHRALAITAAVLAELGLFPPQALAAAARRGAAAHLDKNLEAIVAGTELAGHALGESS